MRVYVYGEPALPAVAAALAAVRDVAACLVHAPAAADVAAAPLLLRKLTPAEVRAPAVGTLIFHPSLLPRHRGRDAIRWAFRQGEPFSGATWFWADDGLDTGDVCEQEVLEILPGERPRDFYARAVVPACRRLLALALADLRAGHVRRRPQRAEAATWEPAIARAEV